MKISTYALIVLGLACIFTTVTTYDSQALPVDKSLVLYLPFDEEEGKKTEDFSMYEHQVDAAAKLEWTDGTFGSALEFDTTNFITVPIEKDLQLRENFTAEF